MNRNTDAVHSKPRAETGNTWDEIVNAEPGYVFHDQFDDGVRFVILRGPASLCAYVGVPKSHPLANFDYDSLPLECHGGLTYAGDSIKSLDNTFYWYGWDYAHCDDASTYDARFPTNRNGKHWTVDLVKDDSFFYLYGFRKLMRLAERIADNARKAPSVSERKP